MCTPTHIAHEVARACDSHSIIILKQEDNGPNDKRVTMVMASEVRFELNSVSSINLTSEAVVASEQSHISKILVILGCNCCKYHQLQNFGTGYNLHHRHQQIETVSH